MNNIKDNIIVGEKFIDLADYKFYPGGDDYNIFKNTFIKDDLKKGKITVYTHIHFIDRLFQYIENEKVENLINLITHNSDYAITEQIFNKKPENIIKWFSQNVDYKNSILKSIPIGLENSRWFINLDKKNKILNKILEPKIFKNNLYINHNINTFPQDRLEPYQIFNGKQWVTIVNGFNGQNFESYLDDVYNHKFVLAPRGNGIDTHRLWECLYLGSIPIVKRSVNNFFYEDLPICFVDEWSEINKDFLNKKYEEIINKKINGEYNFNMLSMSYWESLIKA
jgi:hypothetical protein